MLVIVLACALQVASADVIVQTNSGPVKGMSSLVDGVEAFLGIPYAEPPVGKLRFAKPVQKEPWHETYNASSLPPPCAQHSLGSYYFMPDLTGMSEDCLYLNIWVPKLKYSFGLRRVIIFIHGGGFTTGASSMNVHDGSKLASRGDLIVATINYRLGAFGYFYGFTEDAPGNMGMYDQIMAIKWIKENAQYFGGDPENIVLMGFSAGAFSIAAHMISPLSKHLFKRVILESGSILHISLYDNNTKLYRNSQNLASITGCSNETTTLENSPYFILECLKSKPKETIIEAERTIAERSPNTFFPRVNDDFLPEPIINSFREGKFRKDTEALMGISRDEGSLFLTVISPEYFGIYGNNNAQGIKERNLKFFIRTFSDMMKVPNVPEVTKYYVSSVMNRTSDGYIKVFADMVGDIWITCSSIFTANFLSLKNNPLYFYKFSFRPASTPMAEWAGVTHMDELQYVFGNPLHENFTSEETNLSHLLMDRWSAFAKTGNPNIPGYLPWLPYNYNYSLYLNFGQDEESLRMNPADRCEFWKKIFNAEIDDSLRNSDMNITMEH